MDTAATPRDKPERAVAFLTIETAAMPWQPAGMIGFWKKTLRDDLVAGRSTSLVRIDPGGASPLHSHPTREQVFVIEGAFADQTRTYFPGDFVVREPGVEHTATSETGALLLVVF